jgi:Rod binding domain-containing protein
MAVNSLSSSLNKLGSASCSASSGSRHDELVKTSQRWAAQTFFGTILKQMRNSPFKSELFSGGKQSEAFHELYDQHLAERMARSTGRRLVGQTRLQ